MGDLQQYQYALFLLGAGFSKPAGLPLGPELFDAARREARREYGSDNAVEHDLRTYCEYLRSVDGIVVSPEDVDAEQFMAFLDVEHYLGLLGPETLSTEGNRSQVALKTMIARVLHERTCSALRDPLPVYRRFVDLLKPRDVVITLNYDNLLEGLLDRAGKPYRLFPHRLESAHPMQSTIDSSIDEITILKLHGSIDWFDRRPFDELRESRRLVGSEESPHQTPFGDEHSDLQRLVEGPWRADDPLLSIFRITNPDTYWNYRGRRSPPYILSPSYEKLLYSSAIHSLWWGIGFAGTRCARLVVIGYSLPEHDEYFRQVLYRIVRGYVTSKDLAEAARHPKKPLAIVDYRITAEASAELRDRYRFALVEDAHVDLEGFTCQAVDQLQQLWSTN